MNKIKFVLFMMMVLTNDTLCLNCFNPQSGSRCLFGDTIFRVASDRCYYKNLKKCVDKDVDVCGGTDNATSVFRGRPICFVYVSGPKSHYPPGNYHASHF